jgi:hypothetical protein
LSLFALVTIAVGSIGFVRAATPHGYENTDQANIGTMVARHADPSLYARDYVFHDTRLFRFYTPAYLASIGTLVRWTGSFDAALATLAPVVLALYLIGSFLLLHEITRRSLPAAIISVVSAFPKATIAATFWGVAGADVVMPRTLFTMAIPWLVLSWFLWSEERTWWKLPLVSFCVGLAANFHPVSGFVLLQILLVVLCVGEGMGLRALARAALCGASAVLGVWPTLSNFVRNSVLAQQASAEGPIPFRVVYMVLHERLGTLFPVHPQFLTLGPISLGPAEQMTVVALYLGAMLLIGVASLRARAAGAPRLRRRTLFTLLFSVQLPLAFLLTRFEEPGLIGVVALSAFLSRHRDPDVWDWRFLGWMIAVISLGYVALPFLDLAWRRFEWWSLTSVVGEQLRISGLIYLPLYAFAARALAGLEQRWAPGWERTAFLISLGLVVLRLDAVTATLATATGFALRARLGGSALGFAEPWRRTRGRQLARAALLGAIAALALVAVRLGTTRSGDGSPATAAPWAAWIPASSPREQDAFELYEWAREETPRDSLFYCDSIDFRFRAERSITHSWKDVGLAYYAGDVAARFYSRYFAFQRGYADPKKLRRIAAAHDVDYVVVDKALHRRFTLDLPVAFTNDSYAVYRF